MLNEAHQSSFSIHPGSVKMYKDLKPLYWWLGMKTAITDYVSKCLTCQKVKVEHRATIGLLQPLKFPQWKWEKITMDFVSGLPIMPRKNDAVWVIMDRLTKSAYFIHVRVNMSSDILAEIYIREVIRLHGVPRPIVSDRDLKLTSRFWKSLQKALGTILKLSTDFHPQTDGQSKGYQTSIQMYKDSKPLYWWPGMKTAITDYVSKCLTCQKVKVEHRATIGLLQPLKFPQWKWEKITMDFVSGLPIMPGKNDAVWVIMDRLTKSSYFIHLRVNMSSDILAEIYIREVIQVHGVPRPIVSDRDPKLTSRFWKSLQKSLSTILKLSTDFHSQTDVQSKRKAYANTKKRDIRYEVRDMVFLKVSPWKKVLRFGKKGELSHRYIGLFEVNEKVGTVAYRLALPPEFDKIHNVFHVSMLRRYRSDPSHVFEPEEVELNLDLSYEEEPVIILDRDVKRLRNKNVSLVKVLWRNHKVEEVTWEPKETFRQQYLYLFDSGDSLELKYGNLMFN
ncbi:hypothetical protein V6N13_056875 [Hibiscus sabdariffa]